MVGTVAEGFEIIEYAFAMVVAMMFIKWAIDIFQSFFDIGRR